MHDSYRYHSGATSVIGVGIVTGIVLASWGILSPFVGFMVGAVPTFVIAAYILAVADYE